MPLCLTRRNEYMQELKSAELNGNGTECTRGILNNSFLSESAFSLVFLHCLDRTKTVVGQVND